MIAAKRQAGLTIIEMLLSLVLMSLLLTAIAAATRASLSSYDQNAKSAAVQQAARSLLMRMRREIRTAEAVDAQAESGNLVLSPPASTGIDQIRYEYDAGTQSLYYHRTVGGETTTDTILDGSSTVQITGFSVAYETAVVGEVTCTRRVVVTMALGTGGEMRPVVCSAVPRRNQEY